MQTIEEVRTVKTIRTSGTSLMVSITKEVAMLGLKYGDNIEITLRKVV